MQESAGTNLPYSSAVVFGAAPLSFVDLDTVGMDEAEISRLGALRKRESVQSIHPLHLGTLVMIGLAWARCTEERTRHSIVHDTC